MLKQTILVVRQHFEELLQAKFQIKLEQFPVETPPKPEFGDLALAFCMQLARQLKKAPRLIAQDLVDACGDIEGVRSLKVEGPGYINIFLDREALLKQALQAESSAAKVLESKIIVEHTAINPNKAAHIGHLRNAILGDTLVRSFRYLGHQVEVQNYIDDLGVQVADVVVGFQQLEKKTLADLQKIPEPFDFECWDVYASVGKFYAEDAEREQLRKDTLLALEDGEGDSAEMAEYIVNRVVRCHLKTMQRLGISYDLLPRESSIINLKFWATAFELFKKTGVVYLQDTGKHAGCWVLKTEDQTGSEDPEQQEKVIVRSNGVVTYVGKDMAYQLWKVGKLGLDFYYKPFETDVATTQLWETTDEKTDAQAPAFGAGDRVYNMIDVGQSYTQRIVNQGLRALGYEEEAKQSFHYAYEKVALTPKCAKSLGYELSAEDEKRSVISMSGRKGFGVKADDLISLLTTRAIAEVQTRNPEMSKADCAANAKDIAVGALRYFMLKFGENRVIAFDIDLALAFEGETGPYLQYAVVRAKSILAKLDEREISYGHCLSDHVALAAVADDLDFEQWDLLMSLLRVPLIVRDAAESQSVFQIAKYAFMLAKKFHSFNHNNPVVQEQDEQLRNLRVMILQLFIQEMTELLDIMGVAVPVRM